MNSVDRCVFIESNDYPAVIKFIIGNNDVKKYFMGKMNSADPSTKKDILLRNEA